MLKNKGNAKSLTAPNITTWGLDSLVHIDASKSLADIIQMAANEAIGIATEDNASCWFASDEEGLPGDLVIGLPLGIDDMTDALWVVSLNDALEMKLADWLDESEKKIIPAYTANAIAIRDNLLFLASLITEKLGSVDGQSEASVEQDIVVCAAKKHG